MPTIEIGEFDTVFIVRRPVESPERFHQIVELNEKDLVLTVEANRPNCSTPSIKAYMNGLQIRMLQKLRIEADMRNRIPKLEFSIMSPTIEELSNGSKRLVQRGLSSLKKLLPFATIHEMGLDGVAIQEHGIELDPKYTGPRPSRYKRAWVI